MKLVLIDAGHGVTTKGKRSPDGELLEYKWAREVAQMLETTLNAMGIAAKRIITTDADVPLRERVEAVNAQCRNFGAKNVLLVSVHVNAAGADGKWHDAHGWSAFVSKNASDNSKRFSRLMYNNAKEMGLTVHSSMNANGYCTWSWRDDDIYILKNTLCPAVLTENFFMDNLSDKKFLMSAEGKSAIVELISKSVKSYVAESA